MPKMRWTPTGPGRSRFIKGYAFTPQNGWTVEVRKRDVEELLTYPRETFELVGEPHPLAGKAEDG